MRRFFSTFISMFLLVCLAAPRVHGEAAPAPSFADAVDLSPLDRVAVQWEGRIKSFYAMARDTMGIVTGPRGLEGQSQVFTYLDLMFRPGQYQDRPLVYLKNKPMRIGLSEVLLSDGAVTEEEAVVLRKRGQFSLTDLSHPDVASEMEKYRRDLMKTAKFVNMARFAVALTNPPELKARMCVLPPTGADESDRWHSVGELDQPTMLLPIDPEIREPLREHWQNLKAAWQREDAPAVNAELAAFCDLLPQIEPSIYPSQKRLGWESWYFRAGSMTWGWLIYLLATMFLLGGVVYRWRTARWIGLSVFLGAFGVHTAAIMLRWWVSGRWPNSNMFEAVTTAVWFGALLALGLEWAARRSSMRNLFALTAACASMAALMAARYLPQLDPSIGNMMPILHDIWLYIHTNVIIASYAVIAMASVTGALYLLYRLFGGKADYARVGGAAVLFESGKRGLDESRRASPAEVFDGATMILMELAVVMLWAGLIMGAIWADHSWGRPWGWDPKEVFALNTFLIFLVLVHVRLKVKDKGLWTAVLAILGCAVMLFNWIVINFIITGLHSYA